MNVRPPVNEADRERLDEEIRRYREILNEQKKVLKDHEQKIRDLENPKVDLTA